MSGLKGSLYVVVRTDGMESLVDSAPMRRKVARAALAIRRKWAKREKSAAKFSIRAVRA